MRFQSLLTFAAACSAVRALLLSNGVLRTTLGDQQFSLESPVPAPVVFTDSVESKLEIKFDLEGTSRIPDQIFVMLTNNNGVQTSFKPITSVNSNVFTNKLTLTYAKLPKVFTASNLLDISVVAGDVSDSKPINMRVGQIQLTDALVAESTHEKPEKFGPKPEIHHIFNQPPKTVDPTIALAFSVLSIACLVLVLGAWTMQGSLNFKNFPGIDFNHLIFIGLVLGYELVFLQYYLGCTIFQTIWYIFILLGPSIWFGSRVLNYVGALRLAGQR